MRTFATSSETDSTRARRQELALTAVPGLALLVAATVLAADGGGFGSTTWYPVALTVLAFGVVVVAATNPSPGELWHGVRGALALFGAFVAWCYLSMVWAEVPGEAWTAANRNLLYLTGFALVTLRPWGDRARRLAFAAGIVAVAGIGIALLIVMAVKTDTSTLFLNGRLSAPTDYANATGALFLMGAVPAAWAGGQRAYPVAVRALLVAIATLLLELALLSQSRGSVLAFGVASFVALCLSNRRWATLIATAIPVAATALAWPPLHAVHGATLEASRGALDSAMEAIVLSVVAAALAGGAFALADRRISVRLGPDATRRGNRAMAGLAGVAVLAAIVAVGNPVSWADDRWVDFKTTGEIEGKGSRFSGSLGSERYDFYRVGLNAFVDHPLRGVGADNFGPVYLRDGRSGETPHYAHSLPISTLAETGIVGAVLLLGFLALALRSAVRRARREPETAALAGLLGATVLLAGSLVDWLWQFTGLGVLGLVMLGIAAARRAPSPERPSAPRPPWLRAAARPAAGAVVAAAAVSLVLPGLAARFISSSYEVAAGAPQLAVDRLERAAGLNPLSADPLLARAMLERRLGRPARAREALDEALAREPKNWFAHFERGLLAGVAEQWASAEADLRLASALNPRQPVVTDTLRRIAARRPVDPDQAEQALAAQLESRLRPWAETPPED